MGVHKLLLPWKHHTVIQEVISTLRRVSLSEIVLVTGRAREEVQKILDGELIKFVHNPEYEQTEMIDSLKIGLRQLELPCDAVLIVLGDQPQLMRDTLIALLSECEQTGAELIIPSYQNHRGHPWLLGWKYIPEILALESPQTLRDFMKKHLADIHYLNVNTSTILADLDTPEDYRAWKPDGYSGSSGQESL